MNYDYIIVGTGITGVEALKKLLELDQKASILIIDKEGFLPYKRTDLSKKLINNLENDFVIYDDFSKVTFKKAELLEINKEDNSIILKEDKELIFSYKILIIASGVRAKNIFDSKFSTGLWDKNDAFKLKNLVENKKDITILGAGVTGLEIANLLKDKNINLIDLKGNLLQRNLVDQSDFIKYLLKKKGINLLLDQIENIKENKNDLTLTLKNNGVINTQALIQSISVVANTEFIDAKKDKYNYVIVDKTMQVFDNVFIAGCCINMDNKNYNLWHQCQEMGSFVALNAFNKKHSLLLNKYEAKPYRFKTEIFGYCFFSFIPDKYDKISKYEKGDDIYNLYLENKKLVGAILRMKNNDKVRKTFNLCQRALLNEEYLNEFTKELNI